MKMAPLLLLGALGLAGCGAADCPCREADVTHDQRAESAPSQSARIRVVVLEAGDLDMPDECNPPLSPWREPSSLPAHVELHYADTGQRITVQSHHWSDVPDGPVEVSATLRGDLLYVLDPARLTTSVELSPGAEENVEVTLPRRFVKITSGDAQASDEDLNPKLVIDGLPTTPLVPMHMGCPYYALSVGDHEVDVDSPGGGTVRRQIHVTVDGPRELVVDTTR